MPFGAKKAQEALTALSPAELFEQAQLHKKEGRIKECEARCKMLISSDVKHEHMSAAFHMLAESKMLSAGMPWDLVKDAEEFYQKSMLDEYRPAGTSVAQWNTHKSNTHLAISKLYTKLCDHVKGEQYLKDALELDPKNFAAYDTYVEHLKSYGKVAEAIQLFEKYCKGTEHEIVSSCFYLFVQNYTCRGKDAGERLFQACKTFGNSMLSTFELHRQTEHRNSKDMTRRLKIGYVSGDLNWDHAVARFAEVLLELDRECFEVYAYCSQDLSSRKKGDMSCMVDKWVEIWKFNTGSAVDAIVADEIDILVDLAGFTSGNRLDVFACSPAPVQVTWIGYPNTTGLPTMHYRVTDSTVDPVDTAQRYTENLIRLPDCFLCFAPKQITEMPPVAPPPCDRNGFITFGSFNQICKVQENCFQLWCSVLLAIPNSKINLKCAVFSSKDFREEWHARFEARGIDRDRVNLMTHVVTAEGHLSAYNMHDISLDSFPYNGTTTTVESLLMGVPVITLRSSPDQSLHAHNVSAGILTVMGQPDWVADTEEKYIKIAMDLAADMPRLRVLRDRLRDQFCKSPVGDGKRYRSNVEAMYKKMWQEYCEGIKWPPN